MVRSVFSPSAVCLFIRDLCVNFFLNRKNRQKTKKQDSLVADLLFCLVVLLIINPTNGSLMLSPLDCTVENHQIQSLQVVISSKV